MAQGDTMALAQNYSTVSGTLNYDTFTNWWPNYIYPSCYYPYYIPSVDKGRQAFQIAKALADKKIATPKTIKDFIDLVDTIWQSL